MWGWPLYLAQFAAYPLLVHRVLLPRIKPRSPGSTTPSLGSIYLLAPAALMFLLDPLFLVGASTNNFFSYFLIFEQLIAVLHTFELLYIDADQQKDYLSSFLRFAAFLYVPAKITLMSKNMGGDSLASTSSETLLDPSSEEARRLRKRQNIAQEILSTEQAYVNYLKTFDKWFMKRLTLRDTPILSKVRLCIDFIRDESSHSHSATGGHQDHLLQSGDDHRVLCRKPYDRTVYTC